MDLREIFIELCQRIGISNDVAPQYWQEIEQAYSAKSRYYHNLSHVTEMIGCFETYKSQLAFPDEVLFAIFYHDIIYKSTRKDNERKSAQYAVAVLPETTSINKQHVFDLILATKDHSCNGVEDAKWLIDFDLKILAGDWEDYEAYYNQIRKEYSIYPDFMYNPGRKKAMQHFLEKQSIFQTETFKSLYETRARQNIQREIDQL